MELKVDSVSIFPLIGVFFTVEKGSATKKRQERCPAAFQTNKKFVRLIYEVDFDSMRDNTGLVSLGEQADLEGGSAADDVEGLLVGAGKGDVLSRQR